MAGRATFDFYSVFPSTAYEGEDVKVAYTVENIGDPSSIWVEITVDGSQLIRDVKYLNKYEITQGSDYFTMPDHDVIVDFYCYHWDGSQWILDEHKTKTVTLQVNMSNVTVIVADTSTGGAISNARVELGDETRYTNSNGIATFYVGYGTYSLLVSADGYATHEEGVNIDSDEETFTVYLDPTSCDQVIYVKDTYGVPVGGVRVDVDSYTKYTLSDGRVVFRLKRARRYTVTVSKSGYDSASKSFTACRGDITITITPKTGNIRVISEPEGADIYIDGSSTGYTTNATINDVPIGEHTVSVKLNNQIKSKDVTVEENETVECHFTFEIPGEDQFYITKEYTDSKVIISGVDTFDDPETEIKLYKKSWGSDEHIATAYLDSNHNFSFTIDRPDKKSITVYAKVEKIGFDRESNELEIKPVLSEEPEFDLIKLISEFLGIGESWTKALIVLIIVLLLLNTIKGLWR